MTGTHLELEPGLVCAWLAPLPARLVRERLPRQTQLRAPAKLALTVEGHGQLLAEVVPAGDPATDRTRARDALALAHAWLLDAEDGALPDEPPPASDTEPIETSLSLTPWPWRPLDDGGYRVDVGETGLECRLSLRARSDGVAVSASAAPLSPAGAPAREALQSFALHANRGLRLVRLSVVSDADGSHAVWDALLPAWTPPEPALADVVEALVGARADTLRALRALCDPEIANRYLALCPRGRDPRPEAGARRPVLESARLKEKP